MSWLALADDTILTDGNTLPSVRLIVGTIILRGEGREGEREGMRNDREIMVKRPRKWMRSIKRDIKSE